MFPNIKPPKNPIKYSCDNCNYNTSNKKDFKKHEQTIKHSHTINPNNSYIKNPINLFTCVCGKEYKHNSTLSSHKVKCTYHDNNCILLDTNVTSNSPQVIHLTNLVLELVKNNTELQKQNQDFQNKMLDVCKQSNTTINNNNSVNNNKTFNMQVFLNEKCKDAMNIMEFVNSMTLQLSDLEDVGELGYVEGISKIIIRKLNEMDVYKRPIHCSDYKREVMYVRDDDIWEKENSTYDKIRKAIKYITKKNGDLMIPWRDKHPSCMNTTHRLNDVYLRIMNQSMGGKGEFVDSENKIIKKLSKAVYIDKEC